MKSEFSRKKCIRNVFLTVLFAGIIVFWPLASVSSGIGFAGLWEDNMHGELAIYIYGGIITGLLVGLITGLYYKELVFGGLIPGFVSGFAMVICQASRSEGFVNNIFTGLITGISAGFFIGLGSKAHRPLSSKPRKSIVCLALAAFLGLAFIFIRDPISGLGIGLGVLAGTILALLLIRALKTLYDALIATVKGFFEGLVGKYPFWKSIVSFAVVYIGVVLTFSLWFHACYLESPDFFSIKEGIANRNYWSFVYFSFITITGLGYGDIYPTRPFSQALVALEPMAAIGLIICYLPIVMNLGRRTPGTTTSSRHVPFHRPWRCWRSQ